MNILNEVTNLYADWLSTKDKKSIKEMKRKVLRQKSSLSNYQFITESMEDDGKTMNRIVDQNWSEIAKSKFEAKSVIVGSIKKILEEKENDGVIQTEFGTAYYPISDRSNAMDSEIDVNQRDIVIQIRHAITAGNMTIAAELIKNSWSSLSLKDRNDLIEWVNALGAYNISVPGYEENYVPKTRTNFRMKQLKNKSDMLKTEFAEKFVMTAIKNMKIE